MGDAALIVLALIVLALIVLGGVALTWRDTRAVDRELALLNEKIARLTREGGEQ